jgi:hypothetical protein
MTPTTAELLLVRTAAYRATTGPLDEYLRRFRWDEQLIRRVVRLFESGKLDMLIELRKLESAAEYALDWAVRTTPYLAEPLRAQLQAVTELIVKFDDDQRMLADREELQREEPEESEGLSAWLTGGPLG